MSFGEHRYAFMVGIYLQVMWVGHGIWIRPALAGAIKRFSNVYDLNQLIEGGTPGSSTSPGVVSVFHSNRCGWHLKWF